MLRRTPALLCAAAITTAVAVLIAPGRPLVHQAAASVTTGWPTYHFDNARDGNDSGEPAMTTQNATVLSPALDEKVQAAPLVYSGLVIAATENNTVYAFRETDMTQYWSAHVGTPVADTVPPLNCEGSHLGNSHVGITGTPVIDPVTQIIYAVGLVVDGTQAAGMKYQLYSLHLADGTLANAPVDIVYGDIDPRAEGQRSALLLANGYVYVAFGGRDGDCPPYHPVVVAYNVSTGQLLHWDPQSAGQSEAGIWAPSGFAADAAGDVFAATGNGAQTSCSSPWDHGDGVVKWTAPLTESADFIPSNWCTLSQTDQDVGSIGPTLISGGYLFQAGKAGTGYVIRASDMSLAGSAHIPNCATSDAVFGGLAYDGTHVYVPCNGHGMVALSVSPTSNPPFSQAWFSTCAASPGPPIVAGGFVWATAQFGNALCRYDPTTGASTTFAMGAASRFNTPAADSGRVFVAQNSPSLIRQLNFSNVTPPSPPVAAPVTFSSYFSWYDDASAGMNIDDIHIVNPATSGPNAQGYVQLAGHPSLPFNVAPQHDQLLNWPPGTIGGPVIVNVTAGPPVKASQRVVFGQTFNEVLAQPASAAAQTLYFSWFDNRSAGMNADNIHIVNPIGSGGTATGTVTLNGASTQNFSIVPGGYAQVTFPPQSLGGPVVVNVTSGPAVLASQRVVYYGSFNEVLGQPASAAAHTAYFSWADTRSPGMSADNIHLLAVGSAAAGTVSVPSQGVSQPFNLLAGAETYVPIPSGTLGGPVVVQTTTGSVIASQRVAYYQSFNEVAPLAGPLTTGYFSWFDNKSPGMFLDNIHVLCPPGGSTCSGRAQLGATIANFSVTPGTESTVTFPPGTIGGPVVVTSSPGVYVSQRVTYQQSFNEVPAS